MFPQKKKQNIFLRAMQKKWLNFLVKNMGKKNFE
jgi:hypothetical protein